MRNCVRLLAQMCFAHWGEGGREEATGVESLKALPSRWPASGGCGPSSLSAGAKKGRGIAKKIHAEVELKEQNHRV